MIRVVPSSDAHCLTKAPNGVVDVVDELKAMARTAPPSWSQVDRLAAGYLDQYQYAWRTWRVCGTVPAVAPAAAGSGAGSGSGAP